jgi:hypothetical protein
VGRICFKKIFHIKKHTKMIRIFGQRAFPDAIKGTTLIEIKSRTFSRKQAKIYADYISKRDLDTGKKGAKGVDITDVTYLFLIKPSATEADALKRIFADRKVPLEINYVFDF